MLFVDMTLPQLREALGELESEERVLSKNWMVEDTEDDWSECHREIAEVKRLISEHERK